MDKSVNSFICEVEDNFTNIISNLPIVRADKIGLDSRAGSVYVGEDFLVVLNPKYIDYYGGFEYVDRDARISILEYVIFLGGYCDRVDDALNFYHENTQSD